MGAGIRIFSWIAASEAVSHREASICSSARPAKSITKRRGAVTAYSGLKRTRAKVIRSYGFFSPRSYRQPTVVSSSGTRHE